MKQRIFISLICFLGLKAYAQSNWQFESKIERNHQYYFWTGEIDGKYPIEMYLIETAKTCREYSNDGKIAQGLRGWYQYEKIKKKIPLIGSMIYDAEYFIKLYVPSNPLDTIDRKTCGVKEFKEIFIVENCCSPKGMKWRMADKEDFLPVDLEEKHRYSLATNATIILEIEKLDFTEINLTSLTGIEYIESIEIMSAKAIDNNFFAIIQFGHMTNPISNGRGYCGAGYEQFIGFIKVNNSLELDKFEFYQTASCLKDIPEDLYSFDKKNPENGIKQNK